MAEVAESELNEFVVADPSYIRKTSAFILKLKEVNEPLPENCLLFCFDVCKLYPSVPRKEGIEACREALDSRSNPLIDTENTIRMIETVLENNVFELGNNQFIQTEGVAIGSRLGKNFACTYMRKWDELLMSYEKSPLFYKRFIDDGFGIWHGNAVELQAFAEFANGLHPNIKVELRFANDKIEFLDTLVKIENGHVYTDLYVKPTDKQLYLNSNSCHPPSTKKGIAYGLALRLKRICEKERDYNKRRKDLKWKLRGRGYSGRMIEQQFSRVDRLSRDDLLSNQKNTNSNKNAKRVPLVLTYSNLLPNVHSILRKHQNVLFQSEKLQSVFKNPPMVAYRRDRNLCDTLVHGKTNKLVRKDVASCKQGCNLCDIITTDGIKDSSCQQTFTTPTDVNCLQRNVVYAISCRKCSLVVYVGETERQIRERMTEHLRDVRLAKDKPINVHFSRSDHSCNDMMFTILEKMYGADRIERQMHESAWIKKLKTARPFGCNVKDVDVLSSYAINVGVFAGNATSRNSVRHDVIL